MFDACAPVHLWQRVSFNACLTASIAQCIYTYHLHPAEVRLSHAFCQRASLSASMRAMVEYTAKHLLIIASDSRSLVTWSMYMCRCEREIAGQIMYTALYRFTCALCECVPLMRGCWRKGIAEHLRWGPTDVKIIFSGSSYVLVMFELCSCYVLVCLVMFLLCCSYFLLAT